MQTWSIKYKGHEISVVNKISGERLIVDGELQDENIGLAGRSRLWGKLKSGEGAGEAIKVSLGGWFGIRCRIFVDDTLIRSGS